MKRTFQVLSVVIALFITPLTSGSAKAMGTGNEYLDAQSGLSYTVYAPTDNLGLKESGFKLLACASHGDDWIANTFIKGKKKLEIFESSFDQHCSDPGLSKQLANVKTSLAVAKVYVYCDPANQKKYQKCSTSDFNTVGGYLLITAPGAGSFKKTTLQIQGTGGVTYKELVSVANSMIPSTNILPKSQTVAYAWNCGKLVSKPTSLTIYCADAGIGLAKLKWSSWGGSVATGTGQYYANDCEPNCVSGKVHTSNVKVKLTNPERSGANWSYTKVNFAVGTGNLPLLKKSSETWDLVKTSM